MIVFDNVHKSYPIKHGRNVVLDNINAEFPRGENTAIIGRNGAGKSTLMRLFSGAERPDKGEIHRYAEVSWPLGFRGGLHGALTGKENVALVSRIYDRDFSEMLGFVEDFAEIGKAMDEQVSTYSSGMKARVAFGISMAIKFDYYLIDEVIAVGDASFKKKCKDVLADRLQHATVILVSHSPGLMKDFCNHGAVLENGKLLRFESIRDAIKYYQLMVTRTT